jgi:hypothetical protein
MSQAVDSRCVHQGRNWKLNARMQLVSRSSGDPVVCDSSDDLVDFVCPPFRVVGYQFGETVEDERYHYQSGETVEDERYHYQSGETVEDERYHT